jgi:hypothetical protein
VLLPLARVGIPPLKAHTLDVCLPKLSELISSLSPQQLTAVIATVARADWVGTSLMRDRLLVAAHRMLTRWGWTGVKDVGLLPRLLFAT